MKNVIGVCFFCLLVCGCVTNNSLLVETVPPDQQSVLEVPPYLTVTQFDEIEVKWRLGFWGRQFDFGKIVVNIPSGNHTLTSDYSRQIASGSTIEHWYANNIVISHEFLPLRTYRLVAEITRDRGFIIVNIEEVKE